METPLTGASSQLTMEQIQRLIDEMKSLQRQRAQKAPAKGSKQPANRVTA